MTSPSSDINREQHQQYATPPATPSPRPIGHVARRLSSRSRAPSAHLLAALHTEDLIRGTPTYTVPRYTVPAARHSPALHVADSVGIASSVQSQTQSFNATSAVKAEKRDDDLLPPPLVVLPTCAACSLCIAHEILVSHVVYKYSLINHVVLVCCCCCFLHSCVIGDCIYPVWPISL